MKSFSKCSKEDTMIPIDIYQPTLTVSQSLDKKYFDFYYAFEELMNYLKAITIAFLLELRCIDCCKIWQYTFFSGDLTDINECELPTTSCEHGCINNKGSYNCTCRPGFFLNADKMSCTGIAYGVIFSVFTKYKETFFELCNMTNANKNKSGIEWFSQEDTLIKKKLEVKLEMKERNYVFHYIQLIFIH